MFAFDCEMVLCENGTATVVKVSLVDHNLEVKVDELVNPNMSIADYRTESIGTSAKDLKGVACSLSDVHVITSTTTTTTTTTTTRKPQFRISWGRLYGSNSSIVLDFVQLMVCFQKSMKHHLSLGAILVDQSLNNDLQALKFDHERVIDTCFIFNSVCGPNRRRPSLNDLCKAVLGYEVQKEGAPHNCVDGARVAMKLVLAKLKHGYEDGIKLASEDVLEIELAKLLIHRIPNEAPSQELQTIFPNFDLEIQPRQIRRGKYYSSILVFKNQEEANEAFDSVDLSERKDLFGRPQKMISIKFSTMEEPCIVIVRKMSPNDASLHESTTSKNQPSG